MPESSRDMERGGRDERRRSRQDYGADPPDSGHGDGRRTREVRDNRSRRRSRSPDGSRQQEDSRRRKKYRSRDRGRDTTGRRRSRSSERERDTTKWRRSRLSERERDTTKRRRSSSSERERDTTKRRRSGSRNRAFSGDRDRSQDCERRDHDRDRTRDRVRNEKDRDRDRDNRDRHDRDKGGDRGRDYRESKEDGRQDDLRKQRRHPDDSRERDPQTQVSRSPLRPARPIRRDGPLPSQSDAFSVALAGASGTTDKDKPKEKPNFAATGTLAAESNAVLQADGNTVTLKYHEPPEARKPPARHQWKLFVFKDGDVLDTLDLGMRSCWLAGREAAVVDLEANHPSVSKQHAVIQFRYVEKRNEFGEKLGRVKPYLIDLESANGTLLNGKKIPDSRYLELREKDMIQFANSTREYVLMRQRD